jgi:hypothetical protein
MPWAPHSAERFAADAARAWNGSDITQAYATGDSIGEGGVRYGPQGHEM